MGCWQSRHSELKNFIQYVNTFNLSQDEELKKDLDIFEKNYKEWMLLFETKWNDKSLDKEKKHHIEINLMNVADNMQKILTKLQKSTYSTSKLQARDRQEIVDQACQIWQNALDEDLEKESALEKETPNKANN